MPSDNATVQAYVDLASWYQRQGQAEKRDRFLALAADSAFAAGLPEEGEQLHARLLRYNPHHLLRPFASFAQAMQSPDVNSYLAALRRSHPAEEAHCLLASLKEHDSIPASGERRLAKAVAGLTDTPVTPQRQEARDTGETLRTFRGSSAGMATTTPPPPRLAGATRTLPKEASRPLPPTTPAPPAALSTGSKRIEPAPRAAAPRNARAARQEPQVLPLIRPGVGDDTEREPSGPAWVAPGLFAVLVTVGTVLTAYTLVRPLLTPSLLP